VILFLSYAKHVVGACDPQFTKGFEVGGKILKKVSRELWNYKMLQYH